MAASRWFEIQQPEERSIVKVEGIHAKYYTSIGSLIEHQEWKYHCPILLLKCLLQATMRFLWQSVCICLKGLNAPGDPLEQDYKHVIRLEDRNSSALLFGRQISNCQVLTVGKEALASYLRR